LKGGQGNASGSGATTARPCDVDGVVAKVTMCYGEDQTSSASPRNQLEQPLTKQAHHKRKKQCWVGDGMPQRAAPTQKPHLPYECHVQGREHARPGAVRTLRARRISVNNTTIQLKTVSSGIGVRERRLRGRGRTCE